MREIEISNDENTISLSDEHHDLTLEFFPETKEFKSTLSLKDDVYYRNELYEYKLSDNPIEVFMRLIERSDEPPMRYLVKDGVVLEAEIQKDNKFLGKDLMDGLKKGVEWNKLELSGYYVEIFYILFKHPEIISKNEYKKFLRTTEQRINIGLSKIEKILKEKDSTGLQVIEGEYGKYIWYTGNKIPAELEQKKQSEYVEDLFYKPLFDEKSAEYCGISRNEFENSSAILKHVDELLNGKEAVPSKDSNNEKPKKVYWHWLDYAWAVIVNLITIGVIVSIYSVVTESFEIIVISFLILIYLSIQSFSMIYGKTATETAFALDAEFKRIRKLLKDEPNKSETEGMSEAKKKVDRAMVKMLINAIFLSIIYLIALFHLFGAL